MIAWFEDLPLNFTRPETRRFRTMLEDVYLTHDQLIRLARDVGVRPANLNTTSTLDVLSGDLIIKARNANKLEVLIAEVLRDDRAEAIHKELHRMVQEHAPQIVSGGLLKHPSISTIKRLPTSLNVWPLNQTAAEPLAVAFEKVINDAAPFADPAVFRDRLATAEVRVAQVEVGGKANGTGFLVGPDLLLTTWHVVSSLQAAEPNGIAIFDHKVASNGRSLNTGRRVRFAPNWLVASSQHAQIAEEQSSEGPGSEVFDYALVRLSDPVGRQGLGETPAEGEEARGWYSLASEEYIFDPQEPLQIVGHPRGKPLQLSYANPSHAKLTQRALRVRYRTNTDGGSSGSPVFNKDWNVVALHHAAGPGQTLGVLDNQIPDHFNQGVPISKILGSIREQVGDISDLFTPSPQNP